MSAAWAGCSPIFGWESMKPAHHMPVMWASPCIIRIKHILSMGSCWCRQLACPICMKSYADLAAIWRRVDEEVASTPMPEEYACWVAHILCNDCNQVRGDFQQRACLENCVGPDARD